MKFFVVNEREDPMLVANADKLLHLVGNILSHNGRKVEPNKLTFEVKFLGNPLTEILRYTDLKLNETLHDYLTKMENEWQTLVPLENTCEEEHYNELKKHGKNYLGDQNA